jgi:hypothetical protein
MTISAIKDLRGRFGPVRDQDPRPTCMAFAASDAHAAARDIWQELSTEWAYYHALQRDGSVPHVGATMASMLAGIEVDGQPDEAGWPYIAQMFTDIAAWTPPNAKPLYRRSSLLQSATVNALVAQIDSDKPVLLTMSVSASFFSPRPDGLIGGSEPTEPKRRHAVIAVGHGEHAGETIVLLRNSWGAGWGLAGYGWVTRAYLEPRLLRAATMNGDI